MANITLLNNTITMAATEIRPWGSFTTLEHNPEKRYRIKCIEINPGHRLSLQMHYHRFEHLIVVAGSCKITIGEQQEIINSHKDSVLVPPCTPHRLENPGVIKTIVIEIAKGEYIGEDDIIRYQDDYSRGTK